MKNKKQLLTLETDIVTMASIIWIRHC